MVITNQKSLGYPLVIVIQIAALWAHRCSHGMRRDYNFSLLSLPGLRVGDEAMSIECDTDLNNSIVDLSLEK